MFTPPSPYQNSGSYVDLLRRMTRRVQESRVDDRILRLLHQVFDMELQEEGLMLSRQEKAHLFHQVMEAVLRGMIGKMENS